MKIMSVAKMLANDNSFWKYKVYSDIRGGSSGRGRQMSVGLSTMAIFGNFWRFRWLRLPKPQDMKPALLYGDMLSLVGLLLIAK